MIYFYIYYNYRLLSSPLGSTAASASVAVACQQGFSINIFLSPLSPFTSKSSSRIRLFIFSPKIGDNLKFGRLMGSFNKLSTRSLDTEVPVMVKIIEMSESSKDAIPLAKGVVYWSPPDEALEKVKEIAKEPSCSRYGTHEGLPALREALTRKLQEENKLFKSLVMVTTGSNQGFLNLVLALCDVNDSVVLFAPYFFNAYMSFKMTGIKNILIGPSDPETLQPDPDWLEKILSESNPIPKLVSVVNPGNPSGTCMSASLLKRISDICGLVGSWLVVDNAYEYFTYDGVEHSCVEGKHVINLFSFSKAYGMMGWRVGYIAYSPEAEGLRTQLLKIQDNVSICTSLISQHVALHCLNITSGGRNWVDIQVQTLIRNKELLIDALSPLGQENIKGGNGAIYLWAKLPKKYEDVDFEVVQWLVKKHNVVLLPGSACGVRGCIRVTYGAIREEECVIAGMRLKKGLEELVGSGMVE